MRSTFQIIETSADSDPALIALGDLKIELGITGTTQDEALTTRITRVSLMLAEACNRRFAFAAQAIETFTLDRCEALLPRQPLPLRLYPLVEVESVVVNGVELEIDSSGPPWEFDAESGRIWLVDAAWSGQIVITYSGGYLLPDEAPMRLQQEVVALIRAAIAATASGGVAGEVREVVHGDTRTSFYQSSTGSSTGALSASISADVIAAYKRYALA